MEKLYNWFTEGEPQNSTEVTIAAPSRYFPSISCLARTLKTKEI